MKSYSTFSLQGRRDYQEDRTLIGSFYNFGNKVRIFAIFDGHGGSQTSDWLKHNLWDLFQTQFSNEKLTRSRIQKFIQGVDIKLASDKSIGSSGSTAIIVLLCYDKTILINLGDSRAVCYYKDQLIRLNTFSNNIHNSNTQFNRIIQATVDHSVQNDGFRISQTTAFIAGKYLVHPDNYSQLGLARCFGDFDFKRTNPPFVSNQADVYKLPIFPEPIRIILASDGLWDVFSVENTIYFLDKIQNGSIKRSNTNNSINDSEYIVKTAFKSGSQDNITAIIIDL